MPGPGGSTRCVARPGALTWAATGRWTVRGHEYLEHVEAIAMAPRQNVGRDLGATCEVRDGTWYHRFTIPGSPIRLEARYRQIALKLARARRSSRWTTPSGSCARWPAHSMTRTATALSTVT